MVDPEAIKILEEGIDNEFVRSNAVKILLNIDGTAPEHQRKHAREIVRTYNNSAHTSNLVGALETTEALKSIDNKIKSAQAALDKQTPEQRRAASFKIQRKVDANNAAAGRHEAAAAPGVELTKLNALLQGHEDAPNVTQADIIHYGSLFTHGLLSPNANGNYLIVVEKGKVVESYKLTTKPKTTFWQKVKKFFGKA